MSNNLIQYGRFLTAVKARIGQAQTKAALSANAEMILMYWDMGRMIGERQDREGWGAAVIPHLCEDIHNEFPEMKGFSAPNIGYMIRFAREYGVSVILQHPAAKMDPGEKKAKPLASSSPDLVLENLQQLVVRINSSPGPSIRSLPGGERILRLSSSGP